MFTPQPIFRGGVEVEVANHSPNSLRVRLLPEALAELVKHLVDRMNIKTFLSRTLFFIFLSNCLNFLSLYFLKVFETY